MPSKARGKFDSTNQDVTRLLEIHNELGGTGPGKRYGLEVLNKSAIVLLTAAWEAYCEDVAAEGLDWILSSASSPSSLPLTLRKSIAKELKADPNELAIWGLADTGWKLLVKGRLNAISADRNRRWNTPKSAQVDSLFDEAIGLKSMSAAWRWPGMGYLAARSKLDGFVKLRGAIAHRGSSGTSVKKKQVEEYSWHVGYLVDKTDAKVSSHVFGVAGKAPW